MKTRRENDLPKGSGFDFFEIEVVTLPVFQNEVEGFEGFLKGQVREQGGEFQASRGLFYL
jgi:hypothetical protein